MSTPKQLLDTLVSRLIHLYDGLELVKSSLNELLATNTATGLKLHPQLWNMSQMIASLLCTQEFPVLNNALIWKDKVNICLKSTLEQPLFLTSVQDLILKGQPFNPYLNTSLWEKYPLLLFLIKTVSQGLALNGSNTFVQPITSNSFFSMTKTTSSNPQKMNLLKTCLPLLTVSHPKFTPIVSTLEGLLNPPNPKRCKRTKVLSNQTILKTTKLEIKWTSQNKTNGILQYLHDASNLYNESWNKGVKTLIKMSKPELKKRRGFVKEYKRQARYKSKPNSKISKTDRKNINKALKRMDQQHVPSRFKCSTFVDLKLLRQTIVNVPYRTPRQIDLCQKVPFNGSIVDSAFIGLQTIIKAQKTKKKYLFNVKWRSRKNARIITFNARDYPKLQKKFGSINGLKTIDREFKFLFDKRLKKWFLLLVVEHEVPLIDPQYQQQPRVCSLDPGVRTFQTIFSLSEGCSYDVGTPQNIQTIVKIKKEVEFLRAKQQQLLAEPITPIIKKWISKSKRTCQKLIGKVSNKIKDAQYKLALFLTTNFEIIVLPEFETSNMMSKKAKLHKTSRKEMRDWCHYKFKEILRWMCIKSNKVLVESKEYYTSKTCCVCLKLSNIGSSKVFQCNHCPNILDRDVNGAINNLLIMLK